MQSTHRTISDSVIVITGASSGVGRATALRLAKRGATVVLAARRKDALKEVASECGRCGGRAIWRAVDMGQEEDVQGLTEHTIETFGRIDAWINNAGVTAYGRVEEAPMDVQRQVIETNLLGYIHGARAAIPVFREQGSGVLVNVSSVVGKIGLPLAAAYASTKYAIIGLSDSVRMELMDAPDIHVTTVIPGSIDTPFFQHAANYTGREVKAMAPAASADDVAKAIERCLVHPKREVLVGGSVRVAIAAKIIAPAFTERMIARSVMRSHIEKSPARRGSGRLLEPNGVSSTSGSWRADGSKARKKPVMMTAALAMGSAAALIGLILAPR